MFVKPIQKSLIKRRVKCFTAKSVVKALNKLDDSELKKLCDFYQSNDSRLKKMQRFLEGNSEDTITYEEL